jgi:hypothetical protein
MNKIEAYFRYLMWLINWHLEVKKVGDHWEPRGYWKEGGKCHLHRPVWCPLWFQHLICNLRGYQYSHRSDFTDKKQGLLHGGKGWSKEAFDTLLTNIDREELKEMKNRN